MGITQTQKGEDPHALLPNNPFVPPTGDVCFINSLPFELLSRIFEAGSADDGIEDEDDLAAGDDLYNHFDANIHDSDAEMKEGGNGDEEETDDEGASDETGSSDFSHPFPLVVSHVCRHWRNVAISTPSLWTTIAVAPEARPPYEPVSTLLERSKGLPIDISISCELDEYGDDFIAPSDTDLRLLFAMLIPHVHRWRTMEATVSEYHHMYAFLSAVSDPSIPAASQLTTLELYDHEETENFDTFQYPSMSRHLTLFGGSAPLLARLVLWGVHVDWDQPWIASASNLTDLELAYHPEDVRPSWAQFATILRGAPALKKFSLRQSGPSGDPPEWFFEPTPGGPTDLNAPIQLLRLTDFILAFHSQARAIGLLRKFYLPTLKNLHLDFENDDYTDFVHEITRPATCLYPAEERPHTLLHGLESLKIAGLPCRTEYIKTLYGELQNLTSLNISLLYLDPFFLDILSTPCTLPGHSNVWLPRLATMYVSGTSGSPLRELVSKRREAGVPLTSLYVEQECDVDAKDVEWLRDNVKTFEFFEGSDDEDDFDDLDEEVDQDDVLDFYDLDQGGDDGDDGDDDEWSDMN